VHALLVVSGAAAERSASKQLIARQTPENIVGVVS